jgi:glycosyltransferase involved in cell wall biosynthesis
MNLMQHKLAIVTTHPIQYYAPLFRLLHKQGNVAIKVFYTYEKVEQVFDDGFGKSFSWDIPLLDGYEYSFVSNNGNTNKGFWDVTNPTLNKEIEQWGATAVLVFGWNFKSHLSVLRYFKGKIPVLFRGDSTLLDEAGGIKKILRRALLTWVYKNIDIALYVGNANKAYYEFCGLKEHQLVFAPHAIDNERFAQLTPTQKTFIEETQTSLGTTAYDTTLVFCGKFQPKKNPLLLVEAVKKMANPTIHLIMVGNGELETTLKEAAKSCNNIHFLPFQNQSLMPAVYRLGDIFCLPSQGPGETWGLAVNEAMACSRAVLVSNKCGCATNLVQDGVNGYVFESGNEAQLIETIENLHNKKNQLPTMGKASYIAIQDWSFENIAKTIYTVCQKKG